jgi:flagellar export protein FliJ
MSFEFRFSTLLEFRERQRDEAAAMLAQIDEELRQIAAKREAIAAARTSVRKALQQTRGRIISAQTLQSHNDYLAVLQRDDDMLIDRQTGLTAGLERAREQLTSKHRDVAQLKNLYQQDLTSYQAGVQRAEQREHDSLAATRYRSTNVQRAA